MLIHAPSATRLLVVSLAGLAFVSCKSNAERAATTTAQQWLTLNDAGDYTRSWGDAAPYLQRATTAAQWEASMNRMRKPLGKVLTRTVTTAKATTCALNDPCVVVETNAAFEHEQSARERISVMPGSDGQWRVAGYFIQ